MIEIIHWLTVHTGSSNEPGVAPNYNFWSGAGSDLGEIAIVGGIAQLYRKHNCHVKGCWRVGKFPVEGTPYIVCKRHAPHIPQGDITHHVIIKTWEKLKQDSVSAGAEDQQK